MCLHCLFARSVGQGQNLVRGPGSFAGRGLISERLVGQNAAGIAEECSKIESGDANVFSMEHLESSRLKRR